MSKHTPGPWQHLPDHKDYSDARYRVWGPEGPGHGIIAHTHPAGAPYYEKVAQQHEADARLIAASPDLLAACKGAMSCLTAETEKEWRRSQTYKEAPYHFLLAAILKAETDAK